MRHSLRARRHLVSLGAAIVALAAAAAPAQAREGALAPPPGPEPPATAPAEDLPDAKVILGQVFAALGGRGALDGIQTVRYRLVAHLVDGPSTFDLRSGRDGRFLVNGRSPGRAVVMGRIGDVAWREKSPQGIEILAPNRVGPDLYGFLFILLHQETKITTVDRGDFAGVDCWKLEVTDRGGETAFVRVDVESGLLRGIEKFRMRRGEQRVTRTVFKTYKELAPLRLFTEADVTQEGMALVRFEFSEVSFNTVPESEFRIPPEVLAAFDAKKAKKVAATQPEGNSKKKTAESSKEQQMAMLLEKLKEMDDVGQLQMIAGAIEMQIPKEQNESDRAAMLLVVEKIRERVADLKADATKEDGGRGGG